MTRMAATVPPLNSNLKGVVLAMLMQSLAACSAASEQDEADIPDPEKTQLINYIRACWHLPADTVTSEDFVVTIVMQMNRDATLRSAEISEPDRERMSDPGYRSFAQSALRAVQKCGSDGQAFPINRDRDYEIWSVVRARFRESDFYP